MSTDDHMIDSLKYALSVPSHVRIRPFEISWCPRWDKSDALFYWGRSWQASMKTLTGNRVELYGLRIQIGPVRITLCTFDLGPVRSRSIPKKDDK